MEQLDELTRLAAEELMREAQAFVKKREITSYEPESPKERRKVPNWRFLKNTLRDVMFVNETLREDRGRDAESPEKNDEDDRRGPAGGERRSCKRRRSWSGPEKRKK